MKLTETYIQAKHKICSKQATTIQQNDKYMLS